MVAALRPLHHAGYAVAVPLPRCAGQDFSKLLPCALLRGGFRGDVRQAFGERIARMKCARRSERRGALSCAVTEGAQGHIPKARLNSPGVAIRFRASPRGGARP
jgi:hypothetical protein